MVHDSVTAAEISSENARGSPSWHTSDYAQFISCRYELCHISTSLTENAPWQIKTWCVIMLQVGSNHTPRKSAYRSLVSGTCELNEDHRERRHEVCHLRSAFSPTQRSNSPRSHFCISCVIIKLFCLIDLYPVIVNRGELECGPDFAPESNSYTPCCRRDFK